MPILTITACVAASAAALRLWWCQSAGPLRDASHANVYSRHFINWVDEYNDEDDSALEVRGLLKETGPPPMAVAEGFTPAVDEAGVEQGVGVKPVAGYVPHVSSFHGRHRVVVRAVAHVRAKIGLPKRTLANEMVVRRLVSEFLKDLGVRPTHQLAITPVAVEMAFVPFKADIFARDVAASMPVAVAREAYSVDRVVGRRSIMDYLLGRPGHRWVTRPPTE